MGGIGLVLNTAKEALETAQIGLDVTGNNISNVDTTGYSRQIVNQTNLDPVQIGSNMLGTGVTVQDITRKTDSILQGRLDDQNSSLSAYNEMESYMNTLESYFNETSSSSSTSSSSTDSLSGQLSAFWNSWENLANNPTGSAERQAVYDDADSLSQEFGTLNDEMQQMGTDLTQEIDGGVGQINTLSKQIATLNSEIVSASADSTPNDLLDKRDQLVSQLSDLIGVRSFQQSNGSISVVTESGSVLIDGTGSHQLQEQNGRIISTDSSGGDVDITDSITTGKLGGWLSMRDAVIPQYQNDLNAMAKQFVWEVNQVHSEGVGLDYFSNATTGTYKTDDSGMFSTLDYGNKIDSSGDFKVWVRDTGTSPATYSSVSLGMGVSSTTISQTGGTASSGSAQYQLTVTSDGTVDSTGSTGTGSTISWKKIPSNGSAATTGTATVNANGTLTLDGMNLTISDGTLYAGNTLNINTNSAGNVDNLDVSASGTANSADDTYVFTAKNSGVVGTDSIEYEWHNGTNSGTFTLKAGQTTADVDGMTLDFGPNTATDLGQVFSGDEFTVSSDASGSPTVNSSSDWHWTLNSFATAFNNAAATAGVGADIGATVNSDNQLVLTPASGYQYAFSDDSDQDSGVAAALGFNTMFDGSSAATIGVNSVLTDTDYIAAAKIDGSTGDFGTGDNQNALAIANLQYDSSDIPQWTYDRGASATSSVSTATVDGYYQSMIGSLGVKAQEVTSNTSTAQSLSDSLTSQRDSLSGVNLDEEMINLMQYQHAFAAASKLVSTSDSMFQTLLDMKQ